MRIPDWTPEAQPRPAELVDAILARRGGKLMQLDKALLWSEPVAAGWNVYVKNVRTGLAASRKLRELGICTVALLTGAEYEYVHHAPDFIAAGGTQAELDALQAWVKTARDAAPANLGEDEALVAHYAAEMTVKVKVDDAIAQRMQQRFSTSEVVEITAAIATYNMVARFLVALGIVPDDEH
ncbi:carboxymuconolactone decarboxylase family protein [Ramlibacter sp.]|uniref:carboxymuconolactone decarboxylase family protein n=1 Tax=Ramlibacter sp. TaxID=1917967 RepID=UPI003D1085E1